VAYQPIQSHGVIGNMRTAALVGMDGSIDWLCLPHFDSPSVFAAILDDARGGQFRIAPAETGVGVKQFYWPETNVLITRFLSDAGVGELQDFMPVHLPPASPWQHQLVRRVRVARGTVRFRMVCHPAFDYAQVPHTTTLTRDGAMFETAALSLGLATDVPLVRAGTGVEAEFVLQEDESAVFVLRRVAAGEGCGPCPSRAEAHELFEATVKFWRQWLSACTYTGRWREIVYRSALALKLLTFEPSGAIVAAPTCSLPETLGGGRNWDYRYTWLRDAAFTIYGFLRIGFKDEATRFMDWLDARTREARPGEPLQIVYGIDGRRDLTERTLDHLDGYRGSRPVRIGNAAHAQLQLDIYGELLDAVYLYNKHAIPIGYERWTHLRELLTWLCDNWRREDRGIWEFRGTPRHYVYSKLMCWVAFDRGLRLADKRSFPADRARWLTERDAVYEQIMARGWNDRREAFVQHYESDHLDASNLIMPLVFFVSPNDSRMLKTLAAINRPPRAGGLVSDGLVYRYDGEAVDDGVGGREGTFNLCTFWLVEALTRAGRVDRARVDEARLLFERILGYANHLGLYAEETSGTGDALGNFPQAFTHLSLISAAFNLDRVLGGRA